MKKFKKSTSEEIKNMFKWHNAGISINEISRRLNRHHASVLYWLSKSKDYILGRSGRIAMKGLPKPEWHGVSINEFIKRKNKEEELIRLNKCIVCHKDKLNNKWMRTCYCSLKCWDDEFLQKHPKPKMMWTIKN